jgi:hypothetical protein
MILQISTGQLSLGTQGDDVARVHQAFDALGRSVPVAEVLIAHKGENLPQGKVMR